MSSDSVSPFTGIEGGEVTLILTSRLPGFRIADTLLSLTRQFRTNFGVPLTSGGAQRLTRSRDCCCVPPTSWFSISRAPRETASCFHALLVPLCSVLSVLNGCRAFDGATTGCECHSSCFSPPCSINHTKHTARSFAQLHADRHAHLARRRSLNAFLAVVGAMSFAARKCVWTYRSFSSVKSGASAGIRVVAISPRYPTGGRLHSVLGWGRGSPGHKRQVGVP